MTRGNNELPFFVGVGPVSHDTFVGREDLRQLFGSLTWDREAKKRQDYIIVLEGKTSFGKSSMMRWCLTEVIKKAPNGEVIICTISLAGDQTSADSIKENFYNYLFNETYKAISGGSLEKAWPWKWLQVKWFGKKLVRRLSEHDFGGYNPLKGAKFRQLNSKAYFELLEQLNRGAKAKPKAYAVIIDDLSLNERGPQLCTEMLMDLRAYSESERWPSDFPNFVLVLLPLPGWDDAKTGANKTPNEIGVKRRIDKYEQLQAFSQIEIKDFVQRRCNETGWGYDEKAFIPALFHASGGIPRLMQRIGVEVCDLSKDRKLTAKDVLNALRKPDFHSHIDDIMKNALGFDPEDYLESNEDRRILPLFYRCQPIEKVDWGKAIPSLIKGAAKNEWKKAVLDFTDRSSEIEKSFDKLWGAFSRHGILVHKDGKYRFQAEAIRRHLNSFDPQ